jgi:hypothetical protein
MGIRIPKPMRSKKTVKKTRPRTDFLLVWDIRESVVYLGEAINEQN